MKWAKCNVGAQNEYENGLFFQWGETTQDTDYTWATYKYCNGSETTMTKYCTDSSYGTVDNKTTLDSEDDAATQIMGGKWRMPTLDEFQELYDNTTSVWVEDYNGTDVKGRKFTSKTNGNSIFLPASGFDDGTVIDGKGLYGYYWSSSLHPSESYEGLCLNFSSSHVGPGDFYYRSDGLSVRGVFK